MSLARTHWKAILENGPEYVAFANQGTRVEEGDPEANVVSSELPDGRHAPALDLDCPHTYIPSSTPGHGHLLIDVPMTWREYRRLISMLRRLGIIEPGFARATRKRGRSYLRLPHVKKETS